MSYILDALKKAERERHSAKIPTLETVHRMRWERRHPQWMWIAALVVLVNTALLIWFLRPESMPRSSSSSSAARAPAPAAVPAPPPPVDRPSPAAPAVATTAPVEPVPPAPRASASPEPPE